MAEAKRESPKLKPLKSGHIWLNHRDTFILVGKIQFDNKYETFASSFGLNPLKKVGIISSKPCNLDVRAIHNMKNLDENIMKIVQKTHSPSYRRNIIPVTENQNFGWHAPAMTYDRSNSFFNYGHQKKLFYK